MSHGWRDGGVSLVHADWLRQVQNNPTGAVNDDCCPSALWDL